MKTLLLVVGAIVLMVSPLAAQTTIFSETFEGAFPNTWYVGNDGGIGGYMWGDNSYWAYLGSWSGFCCDSSNGGLNSANTYKNNLSTFMEKRGVSFSSFTSCSLKFRLKMNTESGYDPFTVNVRDQSGAWHQVYIRSGSNPTWPNWDDVRLNLSAFAGQTGVYIQFRFDSDGSVIPSSPAGVWVDEIYCIGRNDPPPTRVDTLTDDASRITYTTTGNNLYRFNQTSGYWAGVGVRPASGDDWDMALTDNNHSTYHAFSTYGGSTVDYVLGNWNSAATGWYGVVVYPYSVTTSARVEYENGADTWTANSSGSITWPTNDVIEVWDSYMYAGSGYRVNLSSVPSNMDVGVAIHGPGSNFQGRYDALVSSDNAGLGGSETVYLTAATTGWHAIVVWSNNGNSGTISTYTITGVAGDPPSKLTPTVFSLGQNRPNPISDRTTIISYALPKETKTELAVYNMSGQLVKTLLNVTQPAGYHNVQWNCRDEQGNKVSSGVYLYRLKAGNFISTKKMVVIR